MTRNRANPKAGFVDCNKLPRGPSGRPLCRQCSVEVPKTRRSFCSDRCVHDWKLRSNPGYLRQQVFIRDRGICAACGVDCTILEHQRRQLCRLSHQDCLHYCQQLRRRGFSSSPNATLWQADHIVAVADGGGECGLENLQTLCTPCHRKKTAEMRTRHKKANNPKAAGLKRKT